VSECHAESISSNLFDLSPDAAAVSQAFGLFPEPDITIQFESVTACQIAANGIKSLVPVKAMPPESMSKEPTK
jgi:hypothetical protein